MSQKTPKEKISQNSPEKYGIANSSQYDLYSGTQSNDQENYKSGKFRAFIQRLLFSQISASRKLEPLSSISDITFLIGAQRSSHLVASLPRAPPHQKHVHLFTTTAITSIQYYHYYLGKYPYPPPNLQQSAKERRLNQLKGEGLVSKSAEGKGEDLKSGKERGRGWIWTS